MKCNTTGIQSCMLVQIMAQTSLAGRRAAAKLVSQHQLPWQQNCLLHHHFLCVTQSSIQDGVCLQWSTQQSPAALGHRPPRGSWSPHGGPCRTGLQCHMPWPHPAQSGSLPDTAAGPQAKDLPPTSESTCSHKLVRLEHARSGSCTYCCHVQMLVCKAKICLGHT